MNRRSFFTHATLALFVVAARAFGRENVATGSLQNRATPLPPEPWEPGDNALALWQAAARRPVVASASPELRPLIAAVQRNQRVRFRYLGGSDFGVEREVVPGLLFTAEGFGGTYLSGYCAARGAERTFRVERMQSVEVEPT